MQFTPTRRAEEAWATAKRKSGLAGRLPPKFQRTWQTNQSTRTWMDTARPGAQGDPQLRCRLCFPRPASLSCGRSACKEAKACGGAPRPIQDIAQTKTLPSTATSVQWLPEISEQYIFCRTCYFCQTRGYLRLGFSTCWDFQFFRTLRFLGVGCEPQTREVRNRIACLLLAPNVKQHNIGEIQQVYRLSPGRKAMPITAFSGPRSSAVIIFAIGLTQMNSPNRSLQRVHVWRDGKTVVQRSMH